MPIVKTLAVAQPMFTERNSAKLLSSRPAPINSTTVSDTSAVSNTVRSRVRVRPPPSERVDINHAGIEDLMKVPGMTQSWAERIVRFRPYRTKQDLLEKGVVNSQVYDRIKDFVIAHRDKQ